MTTVAQKLACRSHLKVVAKNMFKKETNIHLFEGLRVKLSSGETGKIDGPFGQSGKFKISLDSKYSSVLDNRPLRFFTKSAWISLLRPNSLLTFCPYHYWAS